jgi:hypothetical protein
MAGEGRGNEGGGGGGLQEAENGARREPGAADVGLLVGADCRSTGRYGRRMLLWVVYQGQQDAADAGCVYGSSNRPHRRCGRGTLLPVVRRV